MHAPARSLLVPLARCAAAVLFALPLAAHDFWIDPGSHRPERGALVEIGLRVGDFGRGDPVERKAERIVKFVVAGPEGVRDVVGRDGALPAGFLRPKSDGIHAVGFQSNAASVTLDAKQFAAYLAERGLDGIAARRAQRGEGSLPARERYARSAKCLLRVGAGDRGWATVLGLELELTPERDPFALARSPAAGAAGFEELPLRLAFRGEPLAGALVSALCLDQPPPEESTPAGTPPRDAPRVLHARTDAEGRARLALPHEGRWLVSAVHMRALEAGSGGIPEADYESCWASLTFETPRTPPGTERR